MCDLLRYVFNIGVHISGHFFFLKTDWERGRERSSSDKTHHPLLKHSVPPPGVCLASPSFLIHLSSAGPFALCVLLFSLVTVY